VIASLEILNKSSSAVPGGEENRHSTLEPQMIGPCALSLKLVRSRIFVFPHLLEGLAANLAFGGLYFFAPFLHREDGFCI